MERKPLKVGYVYQSGVFQSDTLDAAAVSASALHIKAIIRALEKQGHQVRMVTVRHGSAQYSDNLTDWHPIAVTGLSQSSIFRLIERVVRGIQSRLNLPFARFFDSYHFSDACVSALLDFDVLYERYDFLNYGGIITSKRCKMPILIEVNGDIVEEYASRGIELSAAQWAVSRLISRLTFNGASRIIAVDEAVKKRSVKNWQANPDNITVVRNGTDYDLFSKRNDPCSVRKKYGLQAGPLIGFVGGFKPWHGVDNLILSFQAVHAQMDDVQLVLIGDGPEQQNAHRAVEALGLANVVSFLGARVPDEVAEVFSIVDIAAAPYKNWREATGLKVFDHMASANAIVTSGRNGHHPVLKHMETGALVEPDNVEELTQTILTLLRDNALRKKLGHQAQLKSKETYTWDHTVAEIEDIFYESLKTRL